MKFESVRAVLIFLVFPQKQNFLFRDFGSIIDVYGLWIVGGGGISQLTRVTQITQFGDRNLF